MPYDIVHKKGHSKPWRIIRRADGVDVGGSDTKDKAERSAGYRMSGEQNGPVPRNKVKGYLDD